MDKKKVAVLAAIGVVIGAAALGKATEADGYTPYNATGDVYSGTGWKAFDAAHIYSIDTNLTYVITYDSASTRDKMASSLDTAVGQLQALGVKVYNTRSIETVAKGACAPEGHINVSKSYRPTGKAYTSTTTVCYNTISRSTRSGHIQMDSEYKQLGGTYALSDKIWKGAGPHELGHALGLGHPAATKNSAGDTPVMTSPNGGYKSSASYSKYTSWDLAGFRQMVANFDG